MPVNYSDPLWSKRTYIRSENFNVLPIISNHDKTAATQGKQEPALDAHHYERPRCLCEHLFSQLTCSSALDAVQMTIYSVRNSEQGGHRLFPQHLLVRPINCDVYSKVLIDVSEIKLGLEDKLL